MCVCSVPFVLSSYRLLCHSRFERHQLFESDACKKYSIEIRQQRERMIRGSDCEINISHTKFQRTKKVTNWMGLIVTHNFDEWKRGGRLCEQQKILIYQAKVILASMKTYTLWINDVIWWHSILAEKPFFARR